MKWCSQCTQDDIRDTLLTDPGTAPHRLLKFQLPPAPALPWLLAITQFIVSIKNILSKETKKALGISLWLSWGVLLKPSPSPHLFSDGQWPSWGTYSCAKIRALQGFTMSHTAPSKPARLLTTQRPLKYRIRCAMGFGSQGAAPSTGTLLIPALVAQCSLNLGKKSSQAGKAEVWGRTDTKRQDPAPAGHFSILSILPLQNSTIKGSI